VYRRFVFDNWIGGVDDVGGVLFCTASGAGYACNGGVER